MGVELWAFLGVSAVVILTPGPDMALVTRNAVMHGRAMAVHTALGVNLGLLVWTVASALGLAALVQASAVAFTVLKVAGAAYLVWLGVQTLRAARRPSDLAAVPPGGRSPGRPGDGFRQGLISNIANPKIAVFFTSLLPQFVSAGEAVLLPFLMLGSLFVAMTLVWLCGYALMAARAADVLRRGAVRAAIDRVTGVVLIALGFRLATEPHP